MRHIPHLLLTAILSVLCAGSIPAQERAAVIDGVDLSVPRPPTSVIVAGNANVVYELHVTNFQPVDVTLLRVDVLSGDRAATPIASYRGDEIRKRLGRPGLPRRYETPQVIGPGMRAVMYFWIELADAVQAPSTLRHLVEFEIARASGPVRTVVEGASSSISRDVPIVLSPPVRGGPWTAIYHPLLMGGHRTAIYTIDGRARIPARFAIDWVRLPPSGALEKDPARRSADWNGYGAEVLAVADGTVAAAMDDIAENADPPQPASTPMPLQNASGNYVSLDLGQGRFAFYEHLKRGSVVVKAGERVKAGQVIGLLGNSGSSSMGPHLHFHVSDANSTLGAEGLPFVFTSFDHLGGFASIEALIRGDKWMPVSEGRGGERRLEHPGANWVVRFR